MRDTGLHTPYHIPVNEVAFHPHSFGDRHGRLFRWHGEVYRGISASWAPVLRPLSQDGILDNLVKCGLLIETELTPWDLDSYDLVLRHRVVPHVSYPKKWCAEMQLTLLSPSQDRER